MNMFKFLELSHFSYHAFFFFTKSLDFDVLKTIEKTKIGTLIVNSESHCNDVEEPSKQTLNRHNSDRQI